MEIFESLRVLFYFVISHLIPTVNLMKGRRKKCDSAQNGSIKRTRSQLGSKLELFQTKPASSTFPFFRLQPQVLVRVPQPEGVARPRRPGLGVGGAPLVRELPLHPRDGVPRLRLDLPPGGGRGEPGVLPRGVRAGVRGLGAGSRQEELEEVIAVFPATFL